MLEKHHGGILNLENYRTDKLPNGLFSIYEQYFETIRYQPLTLFELGILNGESLRLWRDYLPRARIIGTDIRLAKNFEQGDRIVLIRAKQSDDRLIRRTVKEFAPEGLDIVIDDASHIGVLSRVSFKILFPYLKVGGFYAIEDWQTGYLSSWPDGDNSDHPETLLGKLWKLTVRCSFRNYARRMPVKIPISSHMCGMVGFLKGLIDNMHVNGGMSPSPFSKVIIYPGVVLVQKADNSIQTRFAS
jgi:hypothetical protein